MTQALVVGTRVATLHAPAVIGMIVERWPIFDRFFVRVVWSDGRVEIKLEGNATKYLHVVDAHGRFSA